MSEPLLRLQYRLTCRDLVLLGWLADHGMLTNRTNLPHLLAVNQFFTDLAGHARIHPETELTRWWPSSR